jgi:polyhydroxybutyrate depolymerase
VALLVGARERTALVHVPAGIPAGRRAALVLALHGVGGNGAQMERYSGFSRVADNAGFVVAYPSSSGPFWNSTASRKLPDDVHFLSQLITYLQQRLCLEAGRVYAAGVSNGGGMVALAGCALSTRLSGFASVAGGYDGQPACRPARPESVLEIHGTADQIVPYFGAGGHPTSDGLPPFVERWVSRDRCVGRPAVTRPATRTTSLRWRRCAAGVQVKHIRIAGGRHQWPGATPPDPGPRSTFCAACTIWSFFSRLRTGPRSWPRR